MDEIPAVRLCCTVNPYFICPACADKYCQRCMYGWMAGRTHPAPIVHNKDIVYPGPIWICAQTNQPIYRNHRGYYAGSAEAD